MGLAELDGAIHADPATAMPVEELAAWVVEQRWFGSKAQEFAEFNVLDAVVLDDGPPLLAVMLLEARLNAGTHELYQLPIVTRTADDAPADGVIVERDGAVLCDALLDPRETARLGELMARGVTVEQADSVVRFHWAGRERPEPDAEVRSMGVEQSNSSIVLDDRFALKVFRRVEAGTNPELEMLTFLASHGFAQIAPLEGSYNYHGPLLDATLGVMQRFIPHAGDGWTLVVDALAGGGGGEELLPRLFDLGVVTGQMHATLASDPEDRDFAPEEPSEEHVALITATIDEQIERTFIELPDLEALEPIRGRAEELRDRLAMLSHHGAGGRLIRCHGDYHLGQTVFGANGWTVLDFEGEPGRPLRERRRKRSPLRDVAGMLRSFAYASLASELLHDAPAPPREWEDAAREQFLAGYMQEVDRQLLPAGAQATAKLLSVFELEKTLYELRYELNNRPDWLAVPVGAIRRLLAEPVP